MDKLLTPIIVDSRYVGRQNALHGIAEAMTKVSPLVMADTVRDHPYCVDFMRAAQEHTGRAQALEAILSSAQQQIVDQLVHIPPYVRPVFLGYGIDSSPSLTGLALKKVRPDTILVSIGPPAVASTMYDLVVVTPADPPMQDPKTLNVHAMPNRITAASLAEYHDAWRSRLANGSSSLVALMVGGSIPAQDSCSSGNAEAFTVRHAQSLANAVLAYVNKHKATLIVTNSVRTPPDVTEVLRSRLAKRAHYFYNHVQGGENPYFGYMACADTVIVTGDSMSMISDAVDAGRITLAYRPEGILPPRHEQFLEFMEAQRQIFDLQSSDNPVPARPVCASLQIAQEICRIATTPT